MGRHRLGSVIIACVTAASVGVLFDPVALGSAPVTAVDGAAVPAAGEQARRVSCSIDVVGVGASRRFVVREIQDGTVLRQKIASRRVGYTPRSAGFLGIRGLSDGYRLHVLAGQPNGNPSSVALRFREWSPTMPVASRRTGPRTFDARLLTSTGRFVYEITDNGRLHRWKVRLQPDGRAELSKRRLVRSGVRDVRTLAFYRRAMVNGAANDLLMVTTRSGALRQIRVPVASPAADRATTIRSSGFAKYTSLSLGTCSGGPKPTMMIVAVNARRNYANWLTFADPQSPAGPNLALRGRVGRGWNWELSATF
jgi:hypothetical protein